jgi:hypothetical protein
VEHFFNSGTVRNGLPFDGLICPPGDHGSSASPIGSRTASACSLQGQSCLRCSRISANFSFFLGVPP